MQFTTCTVVLILAFNFLTPVHPATAQSIPERAYVAGVIGHGQTYNLSCEARGASDLAAFWGVQVSESTLQFSLPRSDNPEEGFVGDVNGTWGHIPPESYGVHAQPIAQLLRLYGLNATPRKGMAWDELRGEIAAGRPVLVWAIGRMWNGTPQIYTTTDGQKIVVAAYEHVMLMVGYDSSSVIAINTGNGSTETFPLTSFLTSWRILENMAVVVNSAPPQPPPPPDNSSDTYIVRPGDYLSKLANQWGVNWREIADLNGISYPYVIYPGQVLKIPGHGPGPALQPTPVPTVTPQPTLVETSTPTFTASATMTPLPVTPTPTLTPSVTPVVLNPATQTPTSAPSTDTPAVISLTPTATASSVPAVTPTPSPIATLTPSPTIPWPTAVPVVTPIPTLTPVPTNQPVEETYIVQPGDYLAKIARMWGVDWRDLAAWNNISYPYIIYSGQLLKKPGSAPTLLPPTELPTPTPGAPPPAIPISGTYTVQPGDYLVKLARQWGVDWRYLAEINNISYPYSIYPGQVLKVP